MQWDNQKYVQFIDSSFNTFNQPTREHQVCLICTYSTCVLSSTACTKMRVKFSTIFNLHRPGPSYIKYWVLNQQLYVNIMERFNRDDSMTLQFYSMVGILNLYRVGLLYGPEIKQEFKLVFHRLKKYEFRLYKN